MGMDLVSDLKEARKELDDLIRVIQNMEHKSKLFQEKIKEIGLTHEQINKIQNAFDDLLKA